MTAAHDLSAAGAGGFLDQLAIRAVREYGMGDDVGLRLLNVSENATFLVEQPVTGARTVLRVHRRGYHGPAQIASELAWLDALRDEAGLRTPRVVDALDGRRIVDLEPGATPRHAVMFEWLPGAEPPDHDLIPWFGTLGAITARMHEHSIGWRPPAGFDRFAWDYDGAFGRVARWGRWQDGIAVGASERAVLGRLDDVLRARLAAYGQGAGRYGLVHADLRLANLLVEGPDTFVIDFDDCGWGWLLYDLGAALSFIEDDPRVPALVAAWVAGYRTVRPLPPGDEAEIPTFVMMRRLLLVAWIGSHSGTDLARSMGASYTAGSCELAETYLSSFAQKGL
jgi:Ser/Thr protein kinase RdoA (MazF antagonist)